MKKKILLLFVLIIILCFIIIGFTGCLDGDDDDKEAEELPLITLIGIIGGSVAAGGIAVFIAWKKQLFTKKRNQES